MRSCIQSPSQCSSPELLKSSRSLNFILITNPSKNTFRNMRDYYKQQDANKFDIEETDKF